MADNRGRDSHNMWTEMPPSRKNKLNQPLQPEKPSEEQKNIRHSEDKKGKDKKQAKKTEKKPSRPEKAPEKASRSEQKRTPSYLEDDGTLAKPMDIQSKVLKNKTKTRNEKSSSAPQKSVKKRITSHFSRNVIFYSIAIVVIVITALVLSNTVLFNITSIDVVGETIYSNNDVVYKSGVELGTNLNSINTEEIEHRLIDELPFVDKVRVSKDFFKSRLVITLNQATPMANIETNDGGFYLISENGRILDSTLTSPDPAYVTVTGFHPEYAVSGAFLSVADEGTRNYLTKLLKSVKVYGDIFIESDIGAGRKIDILYDVIAVYDKVGFSDKIKGIDITSIYAICLDYDGKYTLNLGDDTNMEVKLTIAKNLIDKGEFENEKGELDLSKAADPELGMKVTFRPSLLPGDTPSDETSKPDDESQPDDESKPDDESQPDDESKPDDESGSDEIEPGTTTPPEE